MTKWQRCMDDITTNGGAVFSNKALRKYFREHHCKNPIDKSYIDLADIYGQIVSQGAYWEKQKKTTGEYGFFYTSAAYIADELCLSVRRVSDLIDVLVNYELLIKKIDPGHPNRYAPRPDRLIELTKDVTFKFREQAMDKKYYKEHGKDREKSKNTTSEWRMY